MFTTKKEVDKHIRTTLSKLRSENEKNIRGHTIAKLYFKVGDYNSALHYVGSYLSVKEDSAAAYKLQGQCYEKLNKIDQALTAYQKSLRLDPKQSDLLNDACKIVLSNESILTSGKAHYWCDLAESQNIQHESVLNLKLKLLSRDNTDPKQVEHLILKEIVDRPLDVNLRVRLVKHYLDENCVVDAFKYVLALEMKQNEFFSQSLDWYNAIAQTLGKLKGNESKWPYWLLLVKSLEKQLFLNLCSDSSMTYSKSNNYSDCVSLLHEFDQTLASVSKIIMALCPERELATQFLHHYQGQLCLHAATLLFKRETAQTQSSRETTKFTLPLLLLALNAGTANTEEQWIQNSNESTKQLIRLWSQEGAFRCAQAGRTLLSYIDNTKVKHDGMLNIRSIYVEKDTLASPQVDLIGQIRQYCSDTDWRKNLFRSLFTSSDQLNKQATSYLLTCSAFSEPIYELPRVCDMELYEENGQWFNPTSLAHLVYLKINCTQLANSKCGVINGFNYSVPNLQNCGAETLSQLDVDSFVYAATIQAKHKLDVERTVYESIANGPYIAKPKMIPFANMCNGLITEEQQNWWTAAYKVYKNISGEDLGDIRTTLQYGIEAVRGVNGPKMDLLVALHMGQIFMTRAQESSKLHEKRFLHSRAIALYKYAVHLIKMSKNGREQFRRFFKYSTNEMYYEGETCVLAEKAIYDLGSNYFKHNEFEECISDFQNIQLPFANYFLAHAYYKLYETKNNLPYLQMAQETIQLTQKLLDSSHVDRDHMLRGIIPMDVKRMQQQQQNISFSANSFDDLNDSIRTINRLDTSLANVSVAAAAVASATPPPTQSTAQLEDLIRKMMDMLTDVKDDVNNVRTKVVNIEEQLNKKKDQPATVDPTGLDDYLIFEELQNQGYMNNANMYPAYGQQRIHTPNQMMPQMMAGASPLMQQQSAMNYNNQFYNNVFQQMGVNPYQAMMTPPQPHTRQPTMGVVPQLQCVDPAFAAYSMQQQLPPPPTILPPDNRNSIMGLLTNTPPQQLASQQPPQIQTPPTVPAPAAAAVPPKNDKLLRTWNNSFNNAPVEKTPPVNVVITNSDPLPAHTTITQAQQPTLSVTIPSHHIKNTINANVVSTTHTPVTATVETKSPFGGLNLTAGDKVDKSDGKTKTLFGGLSFSSTPVASPAQDKSKTDNKTADKPNPFANFSFGSTPITFGGAAGDTSKTTAEKSLTNIFSGLATQSAIVMDQKINNKEEVVVEAASAEQNAAAEDGDDDYVPTATFEPVISLPDLIDVKTGEEDEHIAFEHRAKLLRYVKSTKEWKERGIGNMKILVNKNDPNTVRLLMRREQVLKLCCNQLLTKDTKFQPLPKIETAMSWYGQDYSENELQVELLAVRFKTAAICKEFNDAILEAQKNMTDAKGVDNKTTTNNVTAVVNAKNVINEKKESNGFGDKFKAAAGSWNCKSCYLSNKSTDLKCMACDTPKETASVATPVVQPAKPITANNEKPLAGFGDKFKAAAGSWNCKSCYLSNKSTDLKCMACDTPKETASVATPVVQPAKPITANNEKPLAGFGDAFKPKPGAWSCKGCYVSNKADSLYCLACETPKDDTVPKKAPVNLFGSLTTSNTPKFSFGVPAVNLPNATPFVAAPPTTVASISSFSFGTFTAMTTTNTNLFGTPAPAAATKPNSIFSLDTTPKTTTASAAITESVSLQPKESFSFVFKEKSPLKPKSPMTAHPNVSGTEDISDDENIEEENNTYFTPVIALPDKIEVKTGEENETVLYSHRAKLYRFIDSEWKERGLGDIKILKHNETGKLRVVMRREQIFKICLNHMLTSEIDYIVKDDKSYHFVVNDFSEGEVELMQFCVRFKNAEIATEFLAAIKNALGGELCQSNDDDESTEEDKKKIVELKLPNDFYANKPDCTGCAGCNSDDFKFPEIKDINLDIVDANPLPLVKPPSKVVNRPTEKENKVSFSFREQLLNKTSETPSNIFSMANNALNQKASFGESLFTQSVFSPTTIKSSIFGNDKANDSLPTTNIFQTNGGTTAFEKVNNSDIINKPLLFGGFPTTPNKSADVIAKIETPKTSFLFGNAVTATPPPVITSIFSSGFAAKEPAADAIVVPKTEEKIPSVEAQQNIFSTLSQSKATGNFLFGGLSNFGSSTTPVTSSLSTFNFATATSDAANNQEKVTPFKDTGLSFESLAAKTAPSELTSNASSPFSNLQLNSNDANATQKTENLFKIDESLSFASLAQTSKPASASKNSFQTVSTASPEFFGLSNKDAFSSFQPNKSLNGSAADDANADENYDPHYDAIIPLPDEIVVKTGEEEEEKLFANRSKLYRYDATNKEWKERGVGELKILYHPINGTYRLLLRREQVFKCVLNHMLTVECNIKLMKGSDKAFVWASNNYADESGGQLEHLSVRFKNADIAAQFEVAVANCLEKIKSRTDIEPEDD